MTASTNPSPVDAVNTPKLQPPTTSAGGCTPWAIRARPTKPATDAASGRQRRGIATIAIVAADAATAP